MNMKSIHEVDASSRDAADVISILRIRRGPVLFLGRRSLIHSQIPLYTQIGCPPARVRKNDAPLVDSNRVDIRSLERCRCFGRA